MSMRNKFIKIFLPLIIVLLALGIMTILIKGRPEPKKEQKEELGTLVDTFTVKKQDRRVIVTGTGTVQADREVSIIPQVNGKIIYVSPEMKAGSFLKKGDLLFEIEDTDYRLALEQAKASRAKAEYDLASTESTARIARAEWERINRGKAEEPNPLVLYEPQLKNARASLASAEAAVEQAEINLARTKITAPFDCRIRSEDVATGQFVTPGKSAAVIADTDSAEIFVPLSLDELGWLKIPGPGTNGKGSPAEVIMDISGKTYKWEGQVIRSLGEVDSKSRMMQVIMGVQDPYGLAGNKSPGTVLSAGAFVTVRIHGKKLSGVFPVPWKAVRDNSTVWVMDNQNMLRIRPVTIVRREHDEVLVSAGLEEGERIVLTSLAGAADGMKLRLAGERAVR